MGRRDLGQATAPMLFGWLMQLNLRETAITIPTAEDSGQSGEGDFCWAPNCD
jgi:hypothetical protein